MENSDASLVERVKCHRDMRAFRELVLGHQRRLYFLIRRIVRTHHDSEDVLQETFIKALKKIGQLRDNSQFHYWISSIAVNAALTHKRKRFERDAVYFADDLPPEVQSEAFIDRKAGEEPIDAVQGKEIRARLDRALEKLPEKCRTAFVLFHLEEKSAKEIAVMMACPETTVRTWVFRAVKHLRCSLEGYYKAYKE